MRSLNNPYDQIGLDIAEFREEISTNQNFQKVIHSKKSNNNVEIARAGFFSFTSAKNETWGIENKENLEMAKSLIQESKERKGEPFNPAKIDQINDRLLNYSKDAEGANQMLEDGFKEKGLSKVQYQVLKLAHSQFSKAELREASLINNTVEYEVINSGISETDKALLLSVTSVTAHDFTRQLSKLPQFSNSNPLYKNAAAVIIVVKIALGVGAVVGGIIGVIGCCGDFNNQSNCNFNCVAENIADGARYGVIAALAFI